MGEGGNGAGRVDDPVSRALLDAVLGLAGDLELRDLLARIVAPARDLTGPRTAPSACCDPSGREPRPGWSASTRWV